MCIQQNNSVHVCLCLSARVFVRSNTFHLADSDHMQITVETEMHINIHPHVYIYYFTHLHLVSHTPTCRCNTNTRMVLHLAVLRVSCCRTDLAVAGADSTPLTAPSSFALLFFTPITHCRLELCICFKNIPEPTPKLIVRCPSCVKCPIV